MSKYKYKYDKKNKKIELSIYYLTPQNFCLIL